MSKEHEKLKQELNKHGKALIGSVANLLGMKSHARFFPYEASFDTLHLGIKGDRVSIQGRVDTRIHSYLVISGEQVSLLSATGATKELSATRAKEIVKGIENIKSLFTFYDVTPFEIALEVNGDGKVAMVASTSQGRVVIVG